MNRIEKHLVKEKANLKEGIKKLVLEQQRKALKEVESKIKKDLGKQIKKIKNIDKIAKGIEKLDKKLEYASKKVLQPIEIPKDFWKMEEYEKELKALKEMYSPEGVENLKREIYKLITELKQEIEKVKATHEHHSDRIKEFDRTKAESFEVRSKELHGIKKDVNGFKIHIEDIPELKKAIEMVQTELSNFLREIKKNRERIDELEKSRIRDNEIKTYNISTGKDLEDLYRKIDDITSEIKRIENDTKVWMEKTEIEVRTINQKYSGIEKTGDKIQQFGASDIKRDIEAIKMKLKWLEDKVERISVRPLHEKIREIENDVNTFRTSSSALVIE